MHVPVSLLSEFAIPTCESSLVAAVECIMSAPFRLTGWRWDCKHDSLWLLPSAETAIRRGYRVGNRDRGLHGLVQRILTIHCTR